MYPPIVLPWLGVLHHAFGDGPGADLIGYGLGATVSLTGWATPC